MLKNKITKTIAGILIAGQLGLPFLAFAQVGILNLNPVPAVDSGSIIANAAYEAVATAPRGVFQACLAAVNGADAADTGAQLGFSGLSIIGGDSVLLARLTAKITAYQTFLTCANTQLGILQTAPASNVFTANRKQQEIAQINSAIAAYKTKLEDAQARHNNANQGFWKTLVFNILIKTSKSMANALVTKLVSKYRIQNYVQYADSLATLVYDNQFIRQNFPNAQGQFMARAILNNPLVRYKVPAEYFIGADTALGFDPKSLDPNDPNFYTKLASVGSTAANPYFQHTQSVAGVDQAQAFAKTFAQGQIQQGQGFKAPVSCAGSLAQQQSTDAQYKAISSRLDDRKNLYFNLLNAKEAGMKVDEKDLQQAKADMDAAIAAYQKAPTTVAKSPALAICEGIVSPASLIDKGINQAFDSMGVNLKQYNDNNLPAFINLITDAASQIGSSFILGGGVAAKGALLVNEGRLVGGAVTAGSEFAASAASTNLALKGITTFELIRKDTVTNGYTLSWAVDKGVISSASFVTIQGDGISTTKIDPATGQTVPNKLPLSGSATIVTTKGENYIITVFNANGQAVTSGAHNFELTSGEVSNQACGGNYASYSVCVEQVSDEAYCRNICGTVSGAYTNASNLNIRGSQTIVFPRGR